MATGAYAHAHPRSRRRNTSHYCLPRASSGVGAMRRTVVAACKQETHWEKEETILGVKEGRFGKQARGQGSCARQEGATKEDARESSAAKLRRGAPARESREAARRI